MKTKFQFGAILLLPVLLSSCGLFRAFTLNKRLNKPPLVSQKNFIIKKKIYSDGTWIFIYASINGADSSLFMLDTGSPSLISSQTKNKLKIRAKKVIDSVEYCSATATIGNISYQNNRYLVLNYLGIKELIGVNIMQNQIWSFNFLDSTLSITDRLDYISNDAKVNKIHFRPLSKQKTPVIKMTADNNDSVDAIIDMGYSGTTNMNHKFNTEKIKAYTPANVVSSVCKNGLRTKTGKDSVTESFDVKLNSLKIGSYETKNVLVRCNPSNEGLNAIGLGFLKNFIVTIDWIHNDIYLKPIEGRTLKSNKFTYGFDVFPHHGTIKIENIYTNSEAYKQGIRSGDEIESINNIYTKNVPMRTLRSINNGQPNDEEIVIKIKNKEAPIRLKKYSIFE